MPAQKHAVTSAAVLSLTSLNNCLVNLPNSLVSLLTNIDTPVQNVVIELRYQEAAQNGTSTLPGGQQRSVFVGWTGMSSKAKSNILSARGGKAQDVSVVELDTALARAWSLRDEQKVLITVHTNPSQVHTIKIEPVTSDDWELIELHSTFLEINFLSQIRAVPNPIFVPTKDAFVGPKILTLHLSPTSTANFSVVLLEPALAPDVPFAKIAPDAEVIVAPKTRVRAQRKVTDTQSIASASRRSTKSTKKPARSVKPAFLYLRGVDVSVLHKSFEDDPTALDEKAEVSIWVDSDTLLAHRLHGLKYVNVTWIRSKASATSGLAQDQAQSPSLSSKPPNCIVARLMKWEDAPTAQTAGLSHSLCAAFGCPGVVGAMLKIEAASAPLAKKSILKIATNADNTNPALQSIKLHPFEASTQRSAGIRIGAGSKTTSTEAVKRLQAAYERSSDGRGLFQGALTDGMSIGHPGNAMTPEGWAGGLLSFHPPGKDGASSDPRWVNGSEWNVPIELAEPMARPVWVHQDERPAHAAEQLLVVIDAQLAQLRSHMAHMSSVLLTGSQGAGKTAVARSVSRNLQREELFHTSYKSCSTLANDETRISSVKESLTKTFTEAAWGARLGGKSLVVLDNLDKLCPAEQELQVGNENGRNKLMSEMVVSTLRQFCKTDGSVVVLATAQSRDALHHVVTGSHIFRETVQLSAPDKAGRHRLLEANVLRNVSSISSETEQPGSRPSTSDGSVTGDTNGWMDGDAPGRADGPAQASSTGFEVQSDLDLLDIAGQTDGYMPGDLALLVSRARNEALMRVLLDSSDPNSDAPVSLGAVDFANALKGFTPTSLRNVALQSSTTTFSSIGGLHETRRILLETLQYPTKYAPIFAQCPLRLRSGLLLYGYPGCGKTMLASAVAGECGLNFISVKGPEILNKYIGASEKSVRDLFERAQAAKPCVLFFDEFDSIAPKRGHDSTGVTDRVVNQMLTQMDGAEGLSGVYVLAATSRPDLIDPALLRPGRLDKSILCNFPSQDERLDIIKTIGKKVKMSDEVWGEEDDLQELAKRTEGFSGADLQALISNAQLEAIHDVLDKPDQHDAAAPGRRPKHKTLGSRDRHVNGASPRFIQFRYGADGDESNGQAKSGSKTSHLAEQAAIAARLEELKLVRKHAKQKKHGTVADTNAANGRSEVAKDHAEIVIGWKHIIKALENTRASISREERLRLTRIYREFVSGRSGEMHDGQASMEVGGRSSLM